MSEFVPFSFGVPPQFLKSKLSLKPLVRRKIIADDLAALHHEAHTFEFGDVGDGITADRDEVSEFSGLDRADAILPAQHFRSIDRYGANRIQRRQSCTGQVDKRPDTGLSTRLSRIEPAHVGSSRNFDTGFHHSPH